MNNDLGVSIILPTYNRANMLSGSIKSCLNQSYRNLELIVVDDGSKDETEEIVKKFIKNDSRVRYFKKKNEGLPIALNYGFERAKGKFFTWTSDDNYFREDAIDIMINKLSQNQKYKLVYCNYTLIDENDNKVEKVFRKDASFITTEPTVGACFLYDAKCAKIVGKYNPDWTLVEDAEFFVRFAKLFPCKLIEGVHPYFYRVHKESLGWSKFEKVQRIRYQMFSHHSGSLTKRYSLFFKYNYDCAIWFYNNGKGNVVLYLLKCIIMKPYKIELWLLLIKVAVPKTIKNFFKIIIRNR
tara:strand:- start:150 stop:1040 length:891 start_codon:yes stop_codon:yes gene_type:complete